MQDPFVGIWKLNIERSSFDPNHRPTGGTLVFEVDQEGNYLIRAEGADANGNKVTERPQKFIPDGKEYPIPEFRGVAAVTTMPVPNALHSEARRTDGSVVGRGRYVVSEDGKSLTATVAGVDSQLRNFETCTVWDRVQDG